MGVNTIGVCPWGYVFVYVAYFSHAFYTNFVIVLI